MIESGANVNYVQTIQMEKCTALGNAVAKEFNGIARVLLDLGADPNIPHGDSLPLIRLLQFDKGKIRSALP